MTQTDVFTEDKLGDGVLDTLVGEGKKFDNVEALAQGKIKADEHISTIEQENAALKEQLEKSGDTPNVKDLIAAVKEAQATKEGSGSDKTMSTEELEQTIRSVTENDRQAETRASNRAKGNALVLKKAEGNVEAARALVAERAEALGMTTAKLAELSETSPEAFAALLDPSGTIASSGSLSQLPSLRTDVLDASTPVMEIDGYKTKAWFDSQRKEKGHVKYINDSAIQTELSRSINYLGERFNN